MDGKIEFPQATCAVCIASVFRRVTSDRDRVKASVTQHPVQGRRCETSEMRIPPRRVDWQVVPNRAPSTQKHFYSLAPVHRIGNSGNQDATWPKNAEYLGRRQLRLEQMLEHFETRHRVKDPARKEQPGGVVNLPDIDLNASVSAIAFSDTSTP
jgi:hypothetical protein